MNLLKAAIFLAYCLTNAFGQCFREVDQVPSSQGLQYEMDKFFNASNHFSIRLLHALNTSSDAFFSPFSIWTSMVLVFLGSGGTTERELEAVLGLKGIEKNSVAHSYQSLKLWFQSKIRRSAYTSFNMVNHLFLQKDVKIRTCLLQFLDDNLAFVDFFQNPELARIAINYWVRQETNEKIYEILPPFSVHSFTQLIVTSTLYFRGTWLQQFLPHATKPRPFYRTNKDYTLVDMMVTRDTFMYAASDELQCTAIEMPYVGRSLTMVILLPKNRAHGVQILASSLTLGRLDALMEEMFPREVVVVMPKFQMEDSYQLSSTLQKMGLRDLSSGALNLTGFSSETGSLNLNAVYHKAFISVDEQGTEATAGTVTAVSRSSRPTRIIDFVVDRPFVFYIRENSSGSILFMGIIRNPRYLSSDPTVTEIHYV